VATVEQILAALEIENVESQIQDGGFAAIMRDPQPDESGMAPDTDIRVTLVDLNGDPASIPPRVFKMYVEDVEVLSWDGASATWAGPWTGTVTQSGPTDPYVFYDIVAQQTAPPQFTSEQEVDVRIDVGSSSLGWGHGSWGHFPWGHSPAVAGSSLPWTFTIADVDPPSLVSATPIDRMTLRLEFDEPMATSGAGSALNADAYTITRHNVTPTPAVNLQVVSVEAVAGSNDVQFDLTFQWEQTPGCEYQIDVSSTVTDKAGNAIQ